MPLPFPSVSNASLLPVERSFVRLTLLASVLYRRAYVEGAPCARRAEAIDRKAARVGLASERAYAVYHNFYCMWRDNGFSNDFLTMLLSFLS